MAGRAKNRSSDAVPAYMRFLNIFMVFLLNEHLPNGCNSRLESYERRSSFVVS
jgi:hypothetical protein